MGVDHARRGHGGGEVSVTLREVPPGPPLGCRPLPACLAMGPGAVPMVKKATAQ